MARLFLILLLTLGQSPWLALAVWSAPICHDPAIGACAPAPVPTPSETPTGCCPSVMVAAAEVQTPPPPIGCPMTGDQVCTCGVAPLRDLPAQPVPAQSRAEHAAAIVALADPLLLGMLDWAPSRSPRIAAAQPRPPRPHRTIQASFGVWRN